MTELALEGKASMDEILAEGRSVFFQNALQGAIEHMVDPGHANPFTRAGAKMSEADLHALPSWQRHEQEQMQAMAEGIVKQHYEPRPTAPATEQAPQRPVGAAEPSRPGAVAEGAPTRAPPREEHGGTVTARPRQPSEEPLPITSRPALVDQPGSSPLRTAGADEGPVMRSSLSPREEAARLRLAEDERARMRSNIGDDDEGRHDRPTLPPPADDATPIGHQRPPELGSFEAEVKLYWDIYRNTPPGEPARLMPVKAQVDLTPERIEALQGRKLGPGSQIRATDPKSETAALSNYHALRAYSGNEFGMEVLLAKHVITGEYVVVQGEVGKVSPLGDDYVTLRHSHPEIIRLEPKEYVLHALPSGSPGDVGSLMTEAAVQASRPGNGGVFEMKSIIDIHYQGRVLETSFSVLHDNGSFKISVTFTNPDTNQPVHVGTFDSLKAYAGAVKSLTNHDLDISAPPRLGMTTAGDVPVRRGDPVPVEQRGAAQSVAQHVAELAGLDAPARAGRMTEIHEMVKAMGLVGRPDSTARLTNLLNVHDEAFTPRMRSALAQATLEATRAELARSGGLAPGDDVVMLLRGVKGERMADYEK
jgi:hypothetical protein